MALALDIALDLPHIGLQHCWHTLCYQAGSRARGGAHRYARICRGVSLQKTMLSVFLGSWSAMTALVRRSRKPASTFSSLFRRFSACTGVQIYLQQIP